MQDQPTAVELLEALKAFLEHEVRDQLQGSARFHALVAANVCGIVAREISLGPAAAKAEASRLQALLAAQSEPGGSGEPDHRDAKSLSLKELNQRLCRHIEAGAADDGPWRQQVFEHLRQTTAEKLAIDNPKAQTG